MPQHRVMPLVGDQVPFFSFFDDCVRADMQHTRCIANATGVHGHVDGFCRNFSFEAFGV
jgi:hypothetical protein